MVYDEIPRYKKKAKPKTTPKAKHKHKYEPCVLEYEYPDSIAMLNHKTKGCTISSYCPICGKIGSCDVTRWYKPVKTGDGYKIELTEEAKQELNPTTRTVPTFWVDDWLFPKYVDLSESEEK